MRVLLGAIPGAVSPGCLLPVHVGCCAEHEALAVLTTSIYTPKRLADM